MIVWLWPYWPVMYVAREGQQSGNDAKLFVNDVPCRASNDSTLAITRIDSTVWSSVITTTMFGFACGACEEEAEAAPPPTATARRDESAASAAAKRPQALGRLLAIKSRPRLQVPSTRSSHTHRRRDF